MNIRALGVFTLLAFAPMPVAAQTPPSCLDSTEFGLLDFWLGEWTVWQQEEQVGTNRIIKVQDGCAIEEHWTAADGTTGQSLFYYHPGHGRWAQVWVTPYARVPGGLKEKTAVEAPAGSVRFQGQIERPEGPAYLDRTTLTPLAAGQVRQHIEVSTDGGESWRTTFDAVYRPG